MRFYIFKRVLMVAIALFPLWLFAQTTFMPVLSEGKAWSIATISRDYPNDTIGYYNIYVNGDTIVNNFTCKKIIIVPKDNQINTMTSVAYEENGKVWKLETNKEMELLFDIGLRQNDQVGPGNVTEDDVICINGINRKRLVIDSGVDCDDYIYYIVEGIGISSDKFIFAKLGIGGKNTYSCMLSCSENGKIVFTNKDFQATSDMTAGDVNGDGKVNVSDVTALINLILGIK